jgi:hypothetical protein
MPLQKLQFKPGINRETTSYTNEGGWFDGDKIRFRFGMPEKIGGWVKRNTLSFLGTARSLHSFTALDGSNYLAYGTHLKYYLDLGGGLHDITPIRLTSAAGDVTFSAINGSSEITVSHTAHGAAVNDFVTYSGAVSLGGTITANVLNQEYQISEIVTDNSYKIIAREVENIQNITVDGVYTPNEVNANSSDTGNGGASVVGVYQINTGLDVAIMGTGWGAGAWSRGSWGSAASITANVEEFLRAYEQDNFGEDLIFNVRDGNIFYWDKSANVPADPASSFGRAVTLSSLSSDATTPTIAKKIMVSDRDRHVIAFGCDGEISIGTQDPLLIRFSDQEDPLEWQTLPSNTAGELRIGTGSKIVTAEETRQQILVWTDKSLHSMQYLGPPFTFGINLISENITIASPSAAVSVDDFVFWMGLNEFYSYSGSVQRIPCTVRDYVFSDFNTEQYEKVYAGVNSAFGEVWWFYPSENSIENNRYVVYNYQQNLWYYGVLSRTAWIDRGITFNPQAASAGYIYSHETGFDDGSQSPSTAIVSYIESSQLDIGEGDKFTFISKIIPDITFRESSGSPSVDFTVKARNYPGGTYLQTNTDAVERSSTTPVEQFTNQLNIRVRGRSFAFRVDSDSTGVGWRLGSPRVDIRLDGRR